MTYDDFKRTIREYYAANGRHDLPWRQPEADGLFDPYKIAISEVMLQQTQVPRVIPKYHDFLRQFPTISLLAAVPLGAVLASWQGLGYNRRAKFLWQAAQMITTDFNGEFPRYQKQLEQLPGVGANTAGAILAYAFNEPVVFIETNIRTVFIHQFFRGQVAVTDAAIRELVTQTLDHQNPREWYWALMDYGSYLKQTIGNVSRASKSYTKQSTFHGSRRQIRGQVLRLLTSKPMDADQLKENIRDERTAQVIEDLEREGLIRRQGGRYRLP